LLGKPSRSRAEDVLAIFRQRLLSDQRLANSLALLAQAGVKRTVLNRLLYFYAARADRLLHDVVTEMLVPWFRSGRLAVTPVDVEARLQEWGRQGETTGCWSAATVQRVAQGVLATLRDFEVLGGKVLKQITPPGLPVEAAAYIAFVLTSEGIPASELTSAEDWGLFFLEPASVERLLLEAHQLHLLSYAAAGRVVRLGDGKACRRRRAPRRTRYRASGSGPRRAAGLPRRPRTRL
jgi:hypothetical protein